MVAKARQKAADPADAHAQGQWQDKGVTGGVVDSRDFLGELDAQQPAQQGADDRLAFQQVASIGKTGKRGERIIQPERQLGAQGGADDGADAYPDRMVIVAKSRGRQVLPCPQESAKADRVGECLEDRVQRDRRHVQWKFSRDATRCDPGQHRVSCPGRQRTS